MKGWAEAVVAFLSRMTSSAMSVECHLTFVRGKNVRCTDECEQGGDPGSAHNDTDRANHRWLLSSTLRGRRHDSPTRRARDRPPSRRLAASTIPPSQSKTRGSARWLQSVSAHALWLGRRSCPVALPGRPNRVHWVRRPEEVARVRRCEPAATDADGRLRTSLDGSPRAGSKSIASC